MIDNDDIPVVGSSSVQIVQKKKRKSCLSNYLKVIHQL